MKTVFPQLHAFAIDLVHEAELVSRRHLFLQGSHYEVIHRITVSSRFFTDSIEKVFRHTDCKLLALDALHPQAFVVG